MILIDIVRSFNKPKTKYKLNHLHFLIKLDNFWVIKSTTNGYIDLHCDWLNYWNYNYIAKQCKSIDIETALDIALKFKIIDKCKYDKIIKRHYRL